MYCALCGNTIDKEHPLTDPKSHKPDCKMFAGDRQLTEVIKGKDARHPSREGRVGLPFHELNWPNTQKW